MIHFMHTHTQMTHGRTHTQNTLDLDLRAFVTTSSIAAIVGGMGMAGTWQEEKIHRT